MDAEVVHPVPHFLERRTRQARARVIPHTDPITTRRASPVGLPAEAIDPAAPTARSDARCARDHVLEPFEIAAHFGGAMAAASRTSLHDTAHTRSRPSPTAVRVAHPSEAASAMVTPWVPGQAVEIRDHVGDFLIGELGLDVPRHATERVSHVAAEACVGEFRPASAGPNAPCPRHRGNSSTTYCRTRSAPSRLRRFPQVRNLQSALRRHVL